MVALSGLFHKFSRLAKCVSLNSSFLFSSHKVGVLVLLELNMTARGCGGSSSSLPGTPGGDVNSANSVLSWAVSFEKLLEDPHGVCYFTAFLKSEVSAENILFWQECEKFRKIPATSLDQLKAAARSIYGTYLSDSAPYSVNIDDTAKTEEKDLEKPTPDMFNKAQAQIFKLMKMDSYRRFVRSPLYQRCSLASVEGKHLPQLSTEPVRMGSWDDMANKSPTSDKKNRKSDSNSLPSGTSVSEKQRQKRGSWGGSSGHMSNRPLKQSNMSIKSTSSVELGSLCRQMENGRPGPTSRDQAAGIGSRMGVEGGYCCVYLPDGSASLAPTRNGQPIKDMLASLCEKRGFPLKDVMIYLHGKDKPLSLDQDCSVLRDQQVSLELRVTFALENAFTGKTVGIMVKSSKTLQDALCSVMQKHHLKPQETVGSDEPVNLNCSVFRLANKTLRLERAKGFLDMLTRAQCCRVDDQRGLLTKEQLEIPSFLQLSSDQGQNTDDSSECHLLYCTSAVLLRGKKTKGEKRR
uniref:Regulator of G protein signaling 14a n=1 Tax=Xiphophorus couchianus TaxID=32473 RepID=A0A3B5KVV7_9TELE